MGTKSAYFEFFSDGKKIGQRIVQFDYPPQYMEREFQARVWVKEKAGRKVRITGLHVKPVTIS